MTKIQNNRLKHLDFENDNLFRVLGIPFIKDLLIIDKIY